MGDESTPDREAFGEMYPISHDRFGLVNGGTRGGGFGWLYDDVKEEKWERGFFGQADRQFLLETPPTDLTTASARSTRQRIRNRILSTFFDARLLRYIDQRDRKIIFQNARDAGYDLHFREGFKEYVRFTHLGLLELETDINTKEILEAAIREAEQEYALNRGKDVNVQVDIDVTLTDEDSVEELERRYHKRDRLSRHELAALVNSQHENDDGDVEAAAEIDLTDALYYDARQPDSDPHGYSWEDPDREEAEEIVGWLRSLFGEYEIENYDDLEVGMERISLADGDLGDELKRKLSRLSRVAPNFGAQLALVDTDLSKSDMELLHQILYNPDNVDVLTVLIEEARPPTAGEDWSAAEDEYLQKFIARVEADGTPNLGEEGVERWNEFLQLANFDESEWSDYMFDQRVKRCASDIEDWIHNSSESDVSNTFSWAEKSTQAIKADSFEECCELLPTSHAEDFRERFLDEYDEEILNAALRKFGESSIPLGGPESDEIESEKTEEDV